MHGPYSRDLDQRVTSRVRVLASRWAVGPRRVAPALRPAAVALAITAALMFAVSIGAPARAAGLSTTLPNAPAWVSPGHDAQVVNNAFLRLRARPTVHAPILAIMYRGDVVHVLEGPTYADGFAWWFVSFHGQRGYAASNWLAPVSAPVCAVTVDADAVVDNSPYLHLRAGPGIHYAILATMYRGDRVHVFGGPWDADGYHWMRVRDDGQYGYAADAYLVPVSCAPAQRQPVYAQPAHTAPTPGTYAQVGGFPYLHLRTSPSVHARLIATMPEGAEMYVNSGPEYGDGYTWYCVTYHGLSGYAASNWMYPVSSPPVTQ